MKKNLLLICVLLTSSYSFSQYSSNPEPKVPMAGVELSVSDTEKAINQLVKDAYAFISFEKGTKPDYEALRSIFTDDATLYNFRGDSLSFSFIDDFIEGFKSGIERGGMLAFYEVELGGKTEYFGNIGHRISAYASYFDGSEEIGEKGVNSFQVLHVNGKWLINSIIWDVEKDGQAIPARYLK